MSTSASQRTSPDPSAQTLSNYTKFHVLSRKSFPKLGEQVSRPPNDSTCLTPAELSLDPAQPTQVLHHQTPERQVKLDNLLSYCHSATIHATEGAPCRASGITAENIKLRTAFSSKFRPKKMNAAAEATTYNQVAMTAMIVCVSGAVG